jgi:hypothetical protein
VIGEAISDPDRLLDGGLDKLRVARRCQRNPEDAVFEVVGGVGGNLQGEPGLAGSTRANQRDQAMLAEERAGLLAFALASHQRRRLYGQVGEVECPKWREVCVSELVQVLRSREVLQPVLTEVAQVDVDEACRRGRQDYLTTMSSRADASCSVDVDTDVPLVGDERLSRVDPDSYSDLPVRHRGLALDRCGHGVACFREGEEERVSLGVDLDSVVFTECLTKEPAVLEQDPRVVITQLHKQAR